MENLIEILEESVMRNWEKPLTNKWLLNILKMSREKDENDEHYYDIIGASVDIQ
jgi:hypothetical protein